MKNFLRFCLFIFLTILIFSHKNNNSDVTKNSKTNYNVDVNKIQQEIKSNVDTAYNAINTYTTTSNLTYNSWNSDNNYDEKKLETQVETQEKLYDSNWKEIILDPIDMNDYPEFNRNMDVNLYYNCQSYTWWRKNKIENEWKDYWAFRWCNVAVIYSEPDDACLWISACWAWWMQYYNMVNLKTNKPVYSCTSSNCETELQKKLNVLRPFPAYEFIHADFSKAHEELWINKNTTTNSTTTYTPTYNSNTYTSSSKNSYNWDYDDPDPSEFYEYDNFDDYYDNYWNYYDDYSYDELKDMYNDEKGDDRPYKEYDDYYDDIRYDYYWWYNWYDYHYDDYIDEYWYED